MGIQSASKLISERDELQAYHRGSWDVGGGGRDVFAQPQQGDARPQTGKKKKSTILNAGGWKSATLKEVKEALLAFRPHVS